MYLEAVAGRGGTPPTGVLSRGSMGVRKLPSVAEFMENVLFPSPSSVLTLLFP